MLSQASTNYWHKVSQNAFTSMNILVCQAHKLKCCTLRRWWLPEQVKLDIGWQDQFWNEASEGNAMVKLDICFPRGTLHLSAARMLVKG